MLGSPGALFCSHRHSHSWADAVLQGGAGASSVEKAPSTRVATGSPGVIRLGLWSPVSGSAFSQGRGPLLPHVNQAPVGLVSESIAGRLRGQQALKGQLFHPNPASSAPISIQRMALHHLRPTPSPATPTPQLSATSAAVPATLSTFTIPCQLLKPSHQWDRPKPQQCQIPPHPTSGHLSLAPPPSQAILPDLLLLSRSSSLL